MLDDHGEVCEQTVIVELQDGTIFYLEDNNGNSRDETVGTIKTMGILADLAHVEKIPSSKRGVESTYCLPEDPAEQEHIYAKDHPNFFGEIVDIDQNHHNIYIDIGTGTIGVALCRQERDSFPDYRIRDYIRVDGLWAGLVGIWDLDNTGGNGWVHIESNHVNTPSGNQFYSAFGLNYVKREEVKDLIMTGARDGVEIGKNMYRYVEPTSGKALRLFIADNGYIVTAHPETTDIPDGMLKENLKIPVRIVSVRPDAEYQDTVYTQVVHVEFADGTRAAVYDDDLLCTPEMVGRKGKIVLRMLVDDLEKNKTSDRQIYAEPAMPLLEVNGRIDEIIVPDDPEDAVRWHDAVVDFGVGKILIEIDKRYFRLQLKEGDHVRVDGRVDLQEIE
ncbi:hypothetical protein [Methanofollis sp. UBA420]|jgi:hypothetical protein|uniref:hypothetical protein n=1 Tax=Methanofollis sp. UBA420 TaxID=1915514 RepID=UPI00316AE7A9